MKATGSLRLIGAAGAVPGRRRVAANWASAVPGRMKARPTAASAHPISRLVSRTRDAGRKAIKALYRPGLRDKSRKPAHAQVASGRVLSQFSRAPRRFLGSMPTSFTRYLVCLGASLLAVFCAVWAYVAV